MDVKPEEPRTEPPDANEAGEVPFIPASQRAKTEVVVDDTIVVVGQAKRKKRKRAPGEKPAGASVAVQAEEFDYTSVSNILDDGVEDAAAATVKRKRVKGESFVGIVRRMLANGCE